jgi:hypothetical protein
VTGDLWRLVPLVVALAYAPATAAAAPGAAAPSLVGSTGAGAPGRRAHGDD